MRATHDASPHSQIRSSGSELRSKAVATSWMRSFTSRKTASFMPMRSSRLMASRSPRSRPGAPPPPDGLFCDFVSGRGEEVPRIAAYGGVVVLGQAYDPHTILNGRLAQKWDSFQL